MTIFQTLLMRGYFPKELPPAFFTDQFAKYARTIKGRRNLASYKAADNFTECVKYQLALPGGQHRDLRIPHPASFVRLAERAAKNFKKILTRAGRSPFSKSGRFMQPTAGPSARALTPATWVERGGFKGRWVVSTESRRKSVLSVALYACGRLGYRSEATEQGTLEERQASSEAA